MRLLGLLTLGVGLLLPLLTGCPGSLEGTFPPPGGGGGSGGAGGAPPPPPDCDAPAMQFAMDKTCGASTCHGGTFQPDLATAGVWARLMTGTAMQGMGCIGMPLVNPTKPADGALIKRLTGSSCGLQMPLGTAPDQAAITCITGWVNAQLP